MTAWLKHFFQHGRFRKRYDVLNFFARERGYIRYLEIGTATGRCIQKIECAYKVGIDPNPIGNATDWTLHKIASDEFFAINSERFDLILIDGLHRAEQGLRDFINGINVLSPDGIILLHDCNPRTEAAQKRESIMDEYDNWNGDTWKAYVYIRKICPDLFCRVLDFDQEVGIVIPNGKPVSTLNKDLEKRAAAEFDALTWFGLKENRQQWLNLVEGKRALLAEMEHAGIPPHRS